MPADFSQCPSSPPPPARSYASHPPPGDAWLLDQKLMREGVGLAALRSPTAICCVLPDLLMLVGVAAGLDLDTGVAREAVLGVVPVPPAPGLLGAAPAAVEEAGLAPAEEAGSAAPPSCWRALPSLTFRAQLVGVIYGGCSM